MRRGFTLIELLIVMIIVAVMVGVAVPQYRRSVERGRAMEGLTNVRAATDYVLAYMLVHEGALPTNEAMTADLIKSNYFGTPVVSLVAGEEDQYKITVTRLASSGWYYKFVSSFSATTLEPLELVCVNTTSEAVCEQLGFEARVFGS